MKRVAIVGSQQTAHERRKADQNVEDMIFDTVSALLSRTGVPLQAVDAVIGAGDDVLDGRSISNVFTAEYAGAFLKEESKVEDDGAFAALYGAMRIAGGSFDTVLVYAYSKASDSSPQHYSGSMADPFHLRPLGIEAITAAALQARCYYQKWGAEERHSALVAVKNRKHALLNPHAQIKREYSVDQVMSSPLIASPIKRLECSPVTDGCCAMLLAGEEAVRRFGLKPAWILGVGHAADEYYPGHRDLSEVRSARLAARRAYRMAGIHEPSRQIDLAEVHEQFAHQELMLYESLGLCDPGQGPQLIESGNTRADGGTLPVNASGGALSAHPIFAAGLIRLAEAALQITGQAGNRAIEDIQTALAHGTSGLAMQSNIVFVIGSR